MRINFNTTPQNQVAKQNQNQQPSFQSRGFTITDRALWTKARRYNKNLPMGEAVKIARRWAAAMEKQIEKGAKLSDIAEKTEKDVIKPGFMNSLRRGFIVNVLVPVWKHGEELRQWHNLRFYPEQAAEANKTGAILSDAKACTKG